ncbi:MAG TPA: CHAT domain-containing protein [Gemmataceae bacterium]|nr:CHAT domain-containing protein [Gemmataceae bacterium]
MPRLDWLQIFRREPYLEALRALGAGLHGLLSEDLVTKAKACGFPAERPEDEPALTFFEKREPVLWEMMYEGTRLEPLDWQRFWGFRVPTTHWGMNKPPTPREICVRNGLFSAISEDLSGANPEVAALVEQLEQCVTGLRHGRLEQALRERVVRDRRAPAAAEELPREWFRCHLEGKSTVERKRWKDVALVEIFRDARSRYELFHFACHCAADSRTELYSSLVLKVAGEALALDVGLLASDMRPGRGSVQQAGPLVFLNACGTSQPNPSGEPPGFPDVWVSKLGAVAVITTLCPVPDSFAQAFAVKLYGLLFPRPGALAPPRCTHLAEALLATRRYFMEAYNNPLGLAYVLYARQGVHTLPAAGRG